VVEVISILKVASFFYIGYFLLSVLGNLLISFRPITFFTFEMLILYGVSLILGIYMSNIDIFKKHFISFNYKISIKKLIIGISVFTTMSILFSWVYLINYYGNLEYMFLNAYTIRSNSIGQAEGLIPVYLTYMNGLIFALFSIVLSYIGHSGNYKYKLLCVYLFLLILLSDLISFGRIGMLYAIFSIIGYYLVFKKKLFSMQNIMLCITLFLVLSLPRLIRGSFDNFDASIAVYLPYLKYKINAFFNPFIVNYIYYFSAPYALDYYLVNVDIPPTYGMRNFAPIYNFIYRIFDSNMHIGLIDSSAYIPFEYNIYTIVKDLYEDFDVVGVAVIPIFFGVYLGNLFKHSGIKFDALKIYMLGWIFYTPIYNVFSFGAFLISFFFLNLICCFSKDTKV